MVFEVAEAETNNFMLTCFTDLNCQASFSVNSECVGGNCTCLPCYEYIDGLCTAGKHNRESQSGLIRESGVRKAHYALHYVRKSSILWAGTGVSSMWNPFF